MAGLDPYHPLLKRATAVLLAVATDPAASLQRLADAAGCDARHVSRLLTDLERHGYLERNGRGRARRFVVLWDAPLYHGGGQTVGDLLTLLSAEPSPHPKP